MKYYRKRNVLNLGSLTEIKMPPYEKLVEVTLVVDGEER